MKGTEKQIAYARFFVDKFNTEMSGLLKECPEQFRPQWIELQEKVNTFFEEAYAGYIIDLLKSNYSAGKEYYIRFVTSVRFGADPLCNKIRKEFYERKK